MKIYIFILIILISNISAEELILGMDKKEFQAKIFNSMIDGVTGVLSETTEILINPPGLKAERVKTDIARNCNKKYIELYKKTTKVYWKLYHENNEIRKLLTARNINYNIIIKQRMKKNILDINAIKNDSCRGTFIDSTFNNLKKIDNEKQKNIILKELLDMNFIKLEPKKDIYQQSKINTSKEEERANAKADLKRQMQF